MLSPAEAEAYGVVVHEEATYLRNALAKGDEAAIRHHAALLRAVTENILHPRPERPASGGEQPA